MENQYPNFLYGISDCKLEVDAKRGSCVDVRFRGGPGYRLQCLSKGFSKLYDGPAVSPGEPARIIVMESKDRQDEVKCQLGLLIRADMYTGREHRYISIYHQLKMN